MNVIAEKDLVIALPFIIASVVAAAVGVWLYCALSRPMNQRIAILLNGLAIISFLIGEAIAVGPNPQHRVYGFRRVTPISTGPTWAAVAGLALAIILMMVARYFEKKGRQDKYAPPSGQRRRRKGPPL